MSILGNIFSNIVNKVESVIGIKPAAAAAPPAAAAAPAAPAASAAPATPAVPRLDDVDVAKLLDALAAKNPQKLNWKVSIVDMMKLLGMESSLGERKELAKELGYTGDTNDSAKMNIWLHGQVLQKLAANGGKVPAELLQ